MILSLLARPLEVENVIAHFKAEAGCTIFHGDGLTEQLIRVPFEQVETIMLHCDANSIVCETCPTVHY